MITKIKKQLLIILYKINIFYLLIKIIVYLLKYKIEDLFENEQKFINENPDLIICSTKYKEPRNKISMSRIRIFILNDYIKSIERGL